MLGQKQFKRILNSSDQSPTQTKSNLSQETSGSPVIGLDGKIYPMIPTDEDPSGGSTDTGDISWVVPTVRLRVTTGAKGAPLAFVG